MRERTKHSSKPPEYILDEAVARNKQSIRRIQSQIAHVKEALSQIETLQSSLSDGVDVPKGKDEPENRGQD